MIGLLLLNHFYPLISSPTRSNEKESDELLYTVRSLVMVRESIASARGLFSSLVVLQCKTCLSRYAAKMTRWSSGRQSWTEKNCMRDSFIYLVSVRKVARNEHAAVEVSATAKPSLFAAYFGKLRICGGHRGITIYTRQLQAPRGE